MLRRQPPTVLLYSFGLALVLSLGYNGFLLMDRRGHQGRQPDHATATLGSSGTDSLELQEQLKACSQANNHKDSLIVVLEKVAHGDTSQKLNKETTR